MYSRLNLLKQLIRRDVAARYRGSALGIVWTFLTPLLMLGVYTFVFGYVFKARWSGGGMGASQGTGEFALILFSGLLLHGFFAECLNRAPSLILANVNLVKKVVFPLRILVPVLVGAAAVHMLISLLVLLGGILFVHGSLPLTTLWLPVILLPFMLLTLGVCWFLASLGVFIRDIAQTIGIVIPMLLFLSPIFYPLSSLPEWAQPLLYLNPLSVVVEQSRAVLLAGSHPDMKILAIYTAASLAICAGGLGWFTRTRKGFADVL